LPEAYYLSRICEEFGCLPSEAERELRRQPVGWLEEIIEAKHYARAKAVYDRTSNKADVTLGDPMMHLVEENEYEHAGMIIARRRAQMKGRTGGE
jgi:hypothetical protein